MKRFFYGFAFLIGLGTSHNLHAQSDTTQIIDRSHVNDQVQQNKPYLILISVDGFRYDYARKYKAENLLRLSKQGVEAEYMISSYPSLTFPNHYSLVTGLYPAHHGLVDNSFYDYKKGAVFQMHDQKNTVDDSVWYGGIPLWVLAEQQKMLTASFYWVGSEAPIKGLRPTYYYRYNEKIAMDRRLEIVKEWLQLPKEKRPHLITFYFPEVDHNGHTYGPDSKETENAVQLVDLSIGKMMSLSESLNLPVNFIIVSDHGMMKIDTANTVAIPKILRDTSVCRITTGSTLIHVYLKDVGQLVTFHRELRNQAKDFDVYLPEEALPQWHYSKKDDLFNRIGDLIVVSRFPKVFKIGDRKVTPGKHGFDPEVLEMHATFLAWGPAFKNSIAIKPFENVNVFPLAAYLLGLNYTHQIDGNLSELKPILK